MPITRHNPWPIDHLKNNRRAERDYQKWRFCFNNAIFESSFTVQFPPPPFDSAEYGLAHGRPAFGRVECPE
jgi:hypothetical protein